MHEAPIDVLTECLPGGRVLGRPLRVTGGNTDEHLARMTIRASSGVFGWMKQAGVQFQPSLTGTLNLSRTNAFFLGGGKALVNAYYLTAERLGVDILYDSEVVALPMRDGAVRQVEITHKGFPCTVSARCVVAACGGFQANLDWMRQYWGDAVDNFVIRGTPFNRGRLLRNLLDQKVASVGDPTQCHAVALDARAPKFDGGITTRLDSRAVQHRGQPRRRAVLRRGRGRLAQALRHLGTADRAAAGADRLFHLRREVGAAVHAVRLSGGGGGQSGRAGREAGARSGEAARDGGALQRRPCGRAKFDNTKLDGSAHRRARSAQDQLGAHASTRRRSRLPAAPGHHLHLSRRAGERSRAGADGGRAARRPTCSRPARSWRATSSAAAIWPVSE